MFLPSCGVARASEIGFCINLPVFSCAVMRTLVILFRLPDNLSMKLCSSCVIMLNCYKMTMDWS